MDNKIIGLIKFILLLKTIKTQTLDAELPDTSLSEVTDTSDNYIEQSQHTNNKGQSIITGPSHKRPYTGPSRMYKDLSEHAMVTNTNVFPYMAIVLKGTKYLSAGALVDTKWVLTSADGLFMMRESIRFLRVRLGSVNYKKGGVLIPVKAIEIHPYFDDKRPNYDLALILLAKPARFTPTIKAIRVQMVPRELTATHFIVNSWPGPLESKTKNMTNQLQSMEMIKRHRIMTVTHLHPSNPLDCAEELKEIGTSSDSIMCLDPAANNPCMRDVGAPVVLNNILRAVVSSWNDEDCDEKSDGLIFATLVSAKNVSTWLHATVHGHRWQP